MKYLFALAIVVTLANSHPLGQTGSELNLNWLSCPDQTTQCAKDDTCCNTSSEAFGCCPRPNAVCCSDLKHCCPEGYTCNAEKGSCVKLEISFSNISRCKQAVSFEEDSVVPVLDEVHVVRCMDNVSLCNNGYTCCPLKPHSGYGCCEGVKSVCCDDDLHCCPENTTCDVKKKVCTKFSNLSPIKTYSGYHILSDDLCSDYNGCPGDSTCCHVNEAGFNCCPESDAVCCSDMKHCCPSGSRCDIIQKSCIQGEFSFPIMELTITGSTFSPKNIVCPDGKTRCPDKTTCCKLVIPGTYGCCKHPEATCCSDNKYCCPNGYSCDPNSDKCKHGDSIIPVLTALSHSFPLKLKKLCGTDTVCGSNDTCCKHSDGSWACCPSVHAVCCNDGRHCCPENYTCSMVDNTCKKNDENVLFSKIKLVQMEITESRSTNGAYSTLVNAATNICPGDRYDCKDDQTCCLLLSGAWGCCPGKEAVCCPDKEHCCPGGYKCGKDGECLEELH